MKASVVFSLIVLFTIGGIAQGQKKRTPSKPQPTGAATSQKPTSFRDGQLVQTTICKGLPIPEGYVTAGETSASDCRQGAWILKKKGTRLLTDDNEPARAVASTQARRVSLKQVSTDLMSYYRQPLVVAGYVELSDWYFGPYYKTEAHYYAFRLTDDSGESANVYVRRGEQLATKLRTLLLSARGGRSKAMGKFTIIIRELDGDRLSGSIYADLVRAEPPEQQDEEEW